MFTLNNMCVLIFQLKAVCDVTHKTVYPYRMKHNSKSVRACTLVNRQLNRGWLRQVMTQQFFKRFFNGETYNENGHFAWAVASHWLSCRKAPPLDLVPVVACLLDTQAAMAAPPVARLFELLRLYVEGPRSTG